MKTAAVKLQARVRRLETALARERARTTELVGYERLLRINLDILKSLAARGEVTSLAGVLDNFLAKIIKVMNAEAGSFLLMEESGQLLGFTIARGAKAQAVKKYKLKVGEGIAGYVARTRQRMLVPDVSRERRWKKLISREIKYPTRDLVCVPIVARNEVLGVVEIINRRCGTFGKKDLAQLIAFAHQAAVIIDHSRLLTGYRQKFAEINSLLAVSQIINSSLELEAVLGTVLENMIRLIEAEGGSLLLVDQKRQVLEFKIVQGAKADELKRLTLRLGEGIAGWVAAHGRPLLVDDTHRDARFTAKVDQVTRFETKSILCVPLKVKDRVIGVVEVVNKKNRANFTDADVKLLSALASPAAIAIDNAKLYADLEQLFFAVVRSLAATIELRDPYTRGHSGNVARVARLIAAQAGRPATELERLELAGLLHDIGKIGIPEQVLNKPGKLTDEEFRVIQQHPMMGVKVVENVEQLADLVPVMRHHHERFDGKGYPDRLQGTAIPLWARITAIADTYDAMTSDRVYRKGMEPAAALAEINRCSGTQFDPALVKVFNAVFKKGALNRKDQAF